MEAKYFQIPYLIAIELTSCDRRVSYLDLGALCRTGTHLLACHLMILALALYQFLDAVSGISFSDIINQ